MSKDGKDKGREKSESGTDSAINRERDRSSNHDYTEKRDRNAVFDTLKPPPRPGRGNGNDGSDN